MTEPRQLWRHNVMLGGPSSHVNCSGSACLQNRHGGVLSWINCVHPAAYRTNAIAHEQASVVLAADDFFCCCPQTTAFDQSCRTLKPGLMSGMTQDVQQDFNRLSGFLAGQPHYHEQILQSHLGEWWPELLTSQAGKVSDQIGMDQFGNEMLGSAMFFTCASDITDARLSITGTRRS